MFGTGHPRPLHRKVYTLSEYLAFLRDHLSLSLRYAQKPMRMRRIGIPLACACITLLGIPFFLAKKRRMPHCAFRIDGDGIERSSRAGTLVRSWAEIEGVRRYRRGFLVMYDRGGDADSVPLHGPRTGGRVPPSGGEGSRSVICIEYPFKDGALRTIKRVL